MTLRWKYFRLVGLALLIGSPVSCGYRPAARTPRYQQTWDEAGEAFFAVLGDLQRTSPPERLLGREQNDPERARIVEAIAREKPSLLVLLGDLVFDGSSEVDWLYLDGLLRPFRTQGTAVLPALGNHEYWGRNAEAAGHLGRRFPQIRERSWYRRRFGPLGLVWLDSNQEELGEERWRSQSAWYAEALREMDAVPEIRGVLVFVHHPPFTNSTVTGDERHVADAFLESFLAAKKTLALLSGHAHSYEHFVKRDKHFVVSGGGGGPRVTLHEGSERRHEDLFAAPSPRPFHYLLVTPTDEDVRIEVKGLRKGETRVHRIDTFVLPFANGTHR